MLSRLKIAGLGLAGLIAITLTVAACGSDVSESDLEQVRSEVAASNSQLDDVQATLSEISDHMERSQLVAAMSFLNGVAFHLVDEEMQVADEIPGYLRSTITRARQVAAGINWPEDIRQQSDAFIASLHDFEQALQEEDLAESKGQAIEAHRTWHLLEPAAYAYIAGEEPGDHGHEEDQDDHGHDDENGDDHGHDEDNEDDHGHDDEGDDHHD